MVSMKELRKPYHGRKDLSRTYNLPSRAKACQRYKKRIMLIRSAIPATNSGSDSSLISS